MSTPAGTGSPRPGSAPLLVAAVVLDLGWIGRDGCGSTCRATAARAGTRSRSLPAVAAPL